MIMIKILFSIASVLMISLGAFAQKDLDIGKFLDGRYKGNANATEVTIKGKRLKEFKLTLYHSVTIINDDAVMDSIAAAFKATLEEAESENISYTGSNLFYGFCELRKDDTTKPNRFVFFKDMRYATDRKEDKVTLIYMEGSASIEYLKKVLTNND